ncbi:hypothetical protein IGI37_000221 [Enterococcus sp. AZ194]|uniref:DUF1919 domain-containing protein n=1 Tax=Enterococcus sp. AZ194 TaxID=2774629 RepID=UPI003F265FEB
MKKSKKTIPVRIVNKLKNLYFYQTAQFRNRKLVHQDFTILSNNCWGGRISKGFGLPYNSPTVGLSIMSEDYILFLKHLEGFLKSDVFFVDVAHSKWKDYYEETKRFETLSYPTGQIFFEEHCVEIAFINYQTEEEAREKWNRRKKRVNFSKLLIKISEQNDFSEKVLKDFQQLDYPNKICFVCSDVSGPGVYKTASYKGDLDIEDEPKLRFGQEKLVDILNRL